MARLPKMPVQWAFMLFGAVQLWLAWAAWESAGSQNSPALWLGLAAMSLLIWALPTELRQGGLSVIGAFLPWARLTEHEWVGQDGRTLRLRFRSRWLPSSVLLRVPPRDRERVAALLAAHGSA